RGFLAGEEVGAPAPRAVLAARAAENAQGWIRPRHVSILDRVVEHLRERRERRLHIAAALLAGAATVGLAGLGILRLPGKSPGEKVECELLHLSARDAGELAVIAEVGAQVELEGVAIARHGGRLAVRARVRLEPVGEVCAEGIARLRCRGGLRLPACEET